MLVLVGAVGWRSTPATFRPPLYVNTVQRPVGGNLSTPARVATPSNLYYLTPRNYTLSATVRF